MAYRHMKSGTNQFVKFAAQISNLILELFKALTQHGIVSLNSVQTKASIHANATERQKQRKQIKWHTCLSMFQPNRVFASQHAKWSVQSNRTFQFEWCNTNQMYGHPTKNKKQKKNAALKQQISWVFIVVLSVLSSTILIRSDWYPELWWTLSFRLVFGVFRASCHFGRTVISFGDVNVKRESRIRIDAVGYCG